MLTQLLFPFLVWKGVYLPCSSPSSSRQWIALLQTATSFCGQRILLHMPRNIPFEISMWLIVDQLGDSQVALWMSRYWNFRLQTTILHDTAKSISFILLEIMLSWRLNYTPDLYTKIPVNDFDVMGRALIVCFLGLSLKSSTIASTLCSTGAWLQMRVMS